MESVMKSVGVNEQKACEVLGISTEEYENAKARGNLHG